MNGAVYLTIKVPFATAVRVTAQIPPALVPVQRSEMLWTCARAVVGPDVRVTHAGLLLPRSARLRVQARRAAVLKPFELTPLLQSPAGTATAVVALTMLIDAPGLNSFEGCIRQHENGTAGMRVVAGGLEDVSASSFYFQQVGEARYTLPEVGVTHFEWNPHGRVGLYRQFTSDVYLIPFGKDANWTWRNGETLNVADGTKCTSLTGPQIGADVQNATVTTHAWFYEMTRTA